MEHFSHLGTSNNSRGTTTPNSFMYLPSSTHRHHHEPPPPPNFQNHNNIKSSPNPNTSQQNTEIIGSSQNPYARRFIDASSDHDQDSIKAKIISHPQYSSLLVAYMDCQKVGAPPQVAERLSAISKEIEAKKAVMNCRRDSSSQDPELDQFMEAYCNMLMKYREELMRPLHEAMDFLKRVESQLNSITNNGASSSIFTNDEKSEGVGSSEEDQEGSGGEGGKHPAEIDPRAEDKELKNHLLKKYSGYLSSLRHELSKKKKKGKLPKEARQKLLNWWELHYKWPYPSESEKVALAESTGLDQKQINNWFINQRKRHWKPSEDMQFVVMDAFHPQNAAALYMGGGQFMGDASYRLGP